MRIIDSNTLFGFWPKRKVDSSFENLVSLLTKANVERAFTCSMRGVFYDHVEGNDETLKRCRGSGGRLVPVATINPQRYFGVTEEVDRLMGLGFRLIRFFPGSQEWHPAQRHFTRLLEKGTQR